MPSVTPIRTTTHLPLPERFAWPGTGRSVVRISIRAFLSLEDDPFWNHFWTAKLATMGTRGVKTFTRHLRYRNQTVRLPDGKTTTVLVGQEKGIDIRIALDVVRMARENQYEVGLIFSQDQDLSEVADEVRSISMQQNRWIKLACAFPVSPTYINRRGINGTDWIRIDREMYNRYIDTRDYRPKPTE